MPLIEEGYNQLSNDHHKTTDEEHFALLHLISFQETGGILVWFFPSS